MSNQQQQQQQGPHPAQVACEFMSRADLKGKEVDIYAQVYNYLQAILAGELVVVKKEEWEELTAPKEEIPDGEEPPKEEPPKPTPAKKKASKKS